MNKKILIFAFLAPVTAILLSSFQIYYLIYNWRYSGIKTEFTVRQGEGFASINSRLYEAKLISNPRIFYRYCQWNELMTKFKAGVFEIPSNKNIPELVSLLINGKSIQKSVTIPEGKNIYEIANILEKQEIISAQLFLSAAKDTEFTKKLGIDGDTVEGYLYPETYQFAKNISAKRIIESMVSLFNKKTTDINLEAHGLDKKDIITLASIVEKETGAKHERPIIAGVFLNRIKKNMRLQSDPTTIYGIYERYKGNLKKSDLLDPTPYNTYAIKRLPIGPIANPGLDSIRAVLNPAQHNYLFFVSQNDGTHIFSEKYSDHAKAVNTFQKDSKNRVGKSWRNLKQH